MIIKPKVLLDKIKESFKRYTDMINQSKYLLGIQARIITLFLNYEVRNVFMPTVLRVGRYRFHFFSNEGQGASHIHVKAGGDQAKFWLEPIELAANYGFKDTN